MASMFDQVTFAHGPAMPNRVMLAPLTNQQSHADGTLSDDEHRWLTMRALGGFGLTMTCAAHVQQVGQGFAGQLGIFDDRQLDGLARLAADLNATGTVSYVQLHHAGNRSPAALVGQSVCPSDDPATGARALSTAEVEGVVADFVAAAVRAERAGFHGVELHGAHGYLICQFLSSELNHRADAYGGSLENRSRLLFAIVDGVRAACGPDLALAVRLSPERFGMRLDEITEVYARLVASGKVDLVDMSLWDVDKAPIEEHHGAGGTLTDIFAALPRGDVRLGVAGKIHDPADVQRILDRGVDVAVLGRVGILHHDYVRRVAADAAFVPRRPPASRDVLLAEGLSPAFVEYMRASFKGFVAADEPV